MGLDHASDLIEGVLQSQHPQKACHGSRTFLIGLASSSSEVR